ncbi:MAG: general secretion pathway protein GspK, partial [bacterium]|nr:general secretion pathway protein GspK [bacterium]
MKTMTTIPRGVALVAVLSVLTTLALLAAAFAVMMSLETASGRTALGKLQVEMLTQAALEHAQALLREDVWTQPGWDDYSEAWARAFRPQGEEGVELDGIAGGEEGRRGDGRWFEVRGPDGGLLGRYAFMIEDECGKINVNYAAALRSTQQDQGIGTFEVLLTDGQGRGLPLSLQGGERVIGYRYGRDGKPGQGGVDDNFTAMTYEHDGIDNNANGVIDEENEGIDEQEEYDAVVPRWDDRVFSSVREAMEVAMGGRAMSGAGYRALRRYATVVSRGRTMYMDPSEGGWCRQVNINAGSRMQVLKMMRAANFESQFEPNTRRMRGLVANVIDYRDENHVLTTMGDEYGVEGVCFNEILANEGSWSHEADHNEGWTYNRFELVHRYGCWYNLPERMSGVERWGYKMMEVSPPMGPRTVYERGRQVTMPVTARIQLSSDPQRIYASSAYNVFKRIQRDAGGWLPDMWKNGYLKVWTWKPAPDDFEYFPIVENGRDSLVVGFSSVEEYQRVKNWSQSVTNSVWIDTLWRWGDAIWCVMPEATEYWAFPTRYDPGVTPKEGLYYVAYIGEQNFRGNVPGAKFPRDPRTRSGPWRGYNRMMDVDGDPTKYSEREMEVLRQRDLVGTTMEIPDGETQIDLLRWAYKGGEPIRAKNGYIHIVLTTGRETGYAG